TMLVRGSCGWAGTVAMAAGGTTRGSGIAALEGVGAGAVGGGALSAGMGGVSADATTGASGGGSESEGSELAGRSGRGDSVSVWTIGATGSGVAGGMGITRGEEVVTSSVGTGTRPVGVRNHACSVAPTPTGATNPSGARSH